MPKFRLSSLLTGLLSVLFLSQCASPDSRGGPAAAYVPHVSMPDPSRLSANETRYLPEVEDVLVGAGYRPTQGPAEYRLDLHLEDGPVNADSRLRLSRGGTEVAVASAREGGITTMFRRSQVVADSFHRCLNDFQSQLPRSSYSEGGRGEWQDSRQPPSQGGADWQRGW